MAEPFLSEIRLMSFNFAPKGWAQCNGQLLPINQNQALFSLLGTTFGGNGQTTFALPDLRGRVPAHMGPAHVHIGKVSDVLATGASPAGALVGRKGRLGHDMYGAPDNLTALNPAAGGATGGSQPHVNMQPYLTLNFCIALQGIFPSRN